MLSLFPGIGLLDMAFEEEGFCVVRGPDLLWGGAVDRFHPPSGRFDGIIGGPPCQKFSPLQRLVEHNRRRARAAGRTDVYPEPINLIPEFERVVREAAPAWFVMENVVAAPEPQVPGYLVHGQLINNRWCGGEQQRVRRFSFGTKDHRRLHVPGEALEPAGYRPTVCASGSVWVKANGYVGNDGKLRTRDGLKGRVFGDKTSRYLAAALRDQGLPADFLKHAPFTVAGKIKVVGNGVPLPMGRAIAKAVKAALAKECAA